MSTKTTQPERRASWATAGHTHARTRTHTRMHSLTHTHTHTHTHRVCFTWTLCRCNGFYIVQMTFSIALHQSYT